MIHRMSVLTGILLLLVSGTAQAHHVMDGRLPSTFTEGLLSGLGHPIIGLDHLLFVLGIGAIAALYRRGYLLPLAFLAATIAGALLHLRGTDLPAGELLVALSLVAAGIWIGLRARPHVAIAAALLALAGLFHGYAYAESIVGAEPAPLYAYFVGFVTIQYAIALAAFAASRRVAAGHARLVQRGLGGLIGVAGLLFIALNA